MSSEAGLDEAAALAEHSVSRETRDRLRIFARELGRWQAAINLVAPRSIPDLWTRHIADSIQLSEMDKGLDWVDFGSGAGLPGLIIAAAVPGRRVTLIESDSRKCAFLRHVAQEMSVRVEVVEGRIESSLGKLPAVPFVVTARALAHLSRLLGLAEQLWASGSVGLFQKGRNHQRELTEAGKSWRFDVETIPSRTDPEGRILRIEHVARRVFARSVAAP